MKHKQTQFSKTGVIPKRTHGKGIWNGNRKVVCIRLDEKLYKATKPLLKRYFGSVCAAIEPYLATIYSIATTTNLSPESGVIPRITVDVGNVNIRRHLKVRRKMVVEEEVSSFVQCAYCEDEAVTAVSWKGEGEWPLCAFHLETLTAKDKRWKVTSKEVGK